ncbi:MAG: hypothetical protein QM644_01125 [Mobilitalea sp.]
MKKVRCRIAAITIVLLVMPAAVPVLAAEVTQEEAAQAPEKTQGEAINFDPNGTYHAALGVQTCNTLWIGRYAYYEAEANQQYGTDQYSVLFSGGEATNNYVEYAGTFNDAEIKGNGTYTVSLSGADFANEVTLSQLHVATDIPMNESISISDVKMKINGRTLITFEEAFIETDAKFLEGGITFLLVNHWRAPLVKFLSENGLSETGSGVEALRGDGSDEIEITFTVSGFAYDKVEEVVTIAPTEVPAVVPTDLGTGTEKKDGISNTPYIFIGMIVVAGVAVLAGIVLVIVRKNKKK